MVKRLTNIGNIRQLIRPIYPLITGYRLGTNWVQAGYRLGTDWVQAAYGLRTNWVQNFDYVLITFTIEILK